MQLIGTIRALRIAVAVGRVRHALAIAALELTLAAARLRPTVGLVRVVRTVRVAVALALLQDAAAVGALELAGAAGGRCIVGGGRDGNGLMSKRRPPIAFTDAVAKSNYVATSLRPRTDSSIHLWQVYMYRCVCL